MGNGKWGQTPGYFYPDRIKMVSVPIFLPSVILMVRGTHPTFWCAVRTLIQLQRLGAPAAAFGLLDHGVGCGHAGDGDAHG
jgi:hypothetical protein